MIGGTYAGYCEKDLVVFLIGRLEELEEVLVALRTIAWGIESGSAFLNRLEVSKGLLVVFLEFVHKTTDGIGCCL